MRRQWQSRAVAALMLAAATMAGCSQSAPPTSPPSSVSPPNAGTPTASAVASPRSTPVPGRVVVTFRVAGQETYRVLLIDPADIAMARAWLEGSVGPLIPSGHIVRGDDGGVNTGYSWHIDPADVEFAELSIEVCDGLPSHVEDGTLRGDRYCPWSAEIVSLEPFGG